MGATGVDAGDVGGVDGGVDVDDDCAAVCGCGQFSHFAGAVEQPDGAQ